MEYSVKFERYEGPYTKLLELIEERKLSITEIDLAGLADDYIAYTKKLEKKDHLDISQFIVVAATLMLMKVKSLLPKIDYTDAEGKQVEDLTHKLLLLSYLEEIAKRTSRVFIPQKQFFSFGRLRLKKKEYSTPRNITANNLLITVNEILAEGTRESYIKEVSISRKLRIEDATMFIRGYHKSKSTLLEISGNFDDEHALLLSFLSILELVRLGEIDAYQEAPHDIIFERVGAVIN